MADESIMQLVEQRPGDYRADERLAVQFYMGAMQDTEKSREAGRPIFVDTPFVRILVPGDKDNIIDQPVWDDPLNPNSHTKRFARQWAAFKAGSDSQVLVGTPLHAWPGLTRAQVEELAHFGVKTVEQLASLPDVHAQRFMGINALRQRARDFLEAAEGHAPLEKMRAELSQRDNEIEALKEAVKDQAKQLEEMKKSKK